MKLSGRDVRAFLRAPRTGAPAILIHGSDALRVAHARAQVVTGLAGPEADAEMRLTRLSGAELRSDSAALLDAVKAVGFFPGPRVVEVDGATDGLAPTFAAALADWREGDATMVVAAGQLTPRGALRKLFEGHDQALVAPIYDDPASREDVEAALGRSGLAAPSGDTMAALVDLARAMSPSDFDRLLEKTALYKLGDDAPLTPEEVAALAPAAEEAGADAAIHAAVEGRTAELGPRLTRLGAQGTTPVTLAIQALRHVRQLHAASAHPDGPAAGLGRLKPPVYGPRAERMQRQAQAWGTHRLEDALTILIDADLTLRSAAAAPQMAVIERALLRVAALTRR